MPQPSHPVAVVTLFVATLVLALARPWRIPEGVWTIGGAAGMLALGAVRLDGLRTIAAVSHSAILFLVALLVISALVDRSGVFEWAALHAARRARGSGVALFRNVFVLGALVTATLSLDATAVLLTPVVLAFVRRLEVPARPYVIACAFVANAASLALPVSNLSNLILTAAFHVPFGTFVAHMLPIQAGVLALTYASLRLHFGSELTAFDAGRVDESPDAVITHRSYFRAAIAVLAFALVGYLVAPLLGVEPYVVAFVAAAVLGAYGVRAGRVDRSIVREIAWGVLPFVIGLFVVVQGLEGFGLAPALARLLDRTPCGNVGRALATTGASALASNVVNNLPATLIARSALEHVNGRGALLYATLVGTNVGPNLVPFGSLASVLVLSMARERGVHVSTWTFVRAGLVATPIACALAAIGAAYLTG